MKLYPLRNRIKEEFLLGTFITIQAPDLVESLATAGLDFLCLEGEHSAFGIAQMENLIRAANVADLPAVVRVAELGPDISRVLDIGAAGVIVPRIETVEEAREVVRRARYAPEGERGSGPGRATGYGAGVQPYLEQANEKLLVVIQIETARGLEAVEDITAVPGIDGVCVGPFDLALSLGEPLDSPALRAATQQINETARKAGLSVISVCPTADTVQKARNAGHAMIIFGADRLFFMHGVKELVNAARS